MTQKGTKIMIFSSIFDMQFRSVQRDKVAMLKSHVSSVSSTSLCWGNDLVWISKSTISNKIYKNRECYSMLHPKSNVSIKISAFNSAL